MGLMDGKKGVIFGIANDRSYATYIAKQLIEQGAECAFTYLPFGKMERRITKAVSDLGVENPLVIPCDAQKDEDLDAVFEKLKEEWGTIDFIVHSIAFADRQYLQIGNFHTTTREVWTQSLDTSAYTLLAMAQRAMPLMPNGGSIVSMSYYGGEKVIPGYNVMGICKAALEHTTRYLSAELGEKGIRVNSISGGPLKTLAASAVGGIDDMMDHTATKSPIRRNITGEEVGNTAVFLLSDMSTGITGEIIYVDGGFNVVGL